MQIFGKDGIGAELENEHYSFKALLNDSAISLFRSRTTGGNEIQHRSHKVGGLSYEDNYKGNALAVIIKPGVIEIRYHDRFSDERIASIVKEVKNLPEMEFAKNFKVTYQGRTIDSGVQGRSILRYETAHYTEACGAECQDCVKVISDKGRKVILIADGAGGSGGGLVASQNVISVTSRAYRNINTASEWRALLKTIDHSIPRGESTGLIIDIQADKVILASVGDSEAWVFFDSSILRLTEGQKVKPLLGSGQAEPFIRELGQLNKPLLAGTDGFFKYIQSQVENISPLLMSNEFFSTPRKLADLVRLRSGAIQDDIGLVYCRPQIQRQTKTVYQI